MNRTIKAGPLSDIITNLTINSFGVSPASSPGDLGSGERSAVFASGMAAISTTLFAFLRAGDTVLHSRPLYGGTETLLQKQLGAFSVSDVIDTANMRKTADAARARAGWG